jgi:hypothetical protein
MYVLCKYVYMYVCVHVCMCVCVCVYVVTFVLEEADLKTDTDAFSET